MLQSGYHAQGLHICLMNGRPTEQVSRLDGVKRKGTTTLATDEHVIGSPIQKSDVFGVGCSQPRWRKNALFFNQEAPGITKHIGFWIDKVFP